MDGMVVYTPAVRVRGEDSSRMVVYSLDLARVLSRPLIFVKGPGRYVGVVLAVDFRPVQVLQVSLCGLQVAAAQPLRPPSSKS